MVLMESAGGRGKKRDRENEIIFQQSRKTKIHITRMQIKEHPTKGCTLIYFIMFIIFHKGFCLFSFTCKSVLYLIKHG